MRNRAAYFKPAGTDSLMDTGLSMLVPLPYEPAWTKLDDGILNDYPVALSSATPQPVAAVPDTTYGQAIPIPLSVPTASAVLAQNLRRGYLLIENNSSATAPDTAPTLYVSYDGPVSGTLPLQLNKAIPPGSGIVLDRHVPNNAIYVKWGAFVNTGGSAVVGGVIEQGLLPTQ